MCAIGLASSSMTRRRPGTSVQLGRRSGGVPGGYAGAGGGAGAGAALASAAGPPSAYWPAPSTRCRPRRWRDAPASAPAARWHRCRHARRQPARHGPHRSPRPPAPHIGPARPGRQSALEPEEAVELVGHALERTAHRRQLGHRGVTRLGMGHGDFGIPRPPPAAAAHPGGGAPAQVLGRGPPGEALPAGAQQRQRGPGGRVPVRARAAAANGGGRSCGPRRRVVTRPRTTTNPAMRKNSRTWATKVTGPMLRGENPDFPAVPSRHGTGRSRRRRADATAARVRADADATAARRMAARHPLHQGVPPQPALRRRPPDRCLLIVRKHVPSDTQALIVAGCFSVAYILVQFLRQRTVDVVGLAVLVGFVLGVITSTLLGGNAYCSRCATASSRCCSASPAS